MLLTQLKPIIPLCKKQSFDLQNKSINWFLYDGNIGLGPFQLSVAFDIETSYLLCNANEMTGSYMECNTGVIWVKLVRQRR